MLKKLNAKLILTESVFLSLFITGTYRLYIAYQAEFYKALSEEDYEKFYSLTDSTLGELLFKQLIFPIQTFLFGILIVGLVNWINKSSLFNLILTFLIVFSFFLLGFFKDGNIIPKTFNSFCFLFSKDIETAFFVGGEIITLIAVVLLLSVSFSKNFSKTNNT